MLQRTETGRQVAGIVANAVLHNLPLRHLEDMYRAVRALDRESLLAVQQQWFTPSSFAIGMSGDLTLLRSFAHTLGDVTICDVTP
jgi:predicted Zn-dependent peptidase